MFHFAVLGPLQVRANDNTCVLRGPKVGRLLALLLIRSNEVVDVDTLVEELWEPDMRASAQSVLRTHVYHLRRALISAYGEQSVSDRLLTRTGGYLFKVESHELDYHMFLKQVDQARLLLREDRAEDASGMLRSALSLWRGPALAGLSVGRVLASSVAMLNELRSQALELRIEADLRLGCYREVIPELRALIMDNPLNEWLRGQLMLALWRSGRRDEALTTFRDARSALRSELGVEPSIELQRMYRNILSTPHQVRPEPSKFHGLKSGQALASKPAIAS